VNQTKSSLRSSVVNYYDETAAEYADRYRETTPGGLAFILRRQCVLELFDQPGGSVLDVGCGPGIMAESLLALNCTFSGIDPSPNMIAEAQRRFDSTARAHFSIGEAEAIPFPEDSFDAVLCMGVFERVADEGRALREMVRVLRPGGTLIVTVPHRFSPYLLWRNLVFYPIVRILRPVYYALRRQAPPDVAPGHRVYAVRSLVRMLGEHGCEVRDVAFCGFPVLWPPLDALFPALASALMARAEALRHGRWRPLAACVVVKARRP